MKMGFCLMMIFSGVICSCISLPVSKADAQNDRQTLVKGNNALGFDLYHKFKGAPGNIFFSPYSISSALTMAYEGAKGKTAKEMQTVLYLPDDKTRIRSDFKDLYDDIMKANKAYQLTSANAVWAQDDYPFIRDYVNVVKTYYGGQVLNLDFKTKTEDSRITINRWIENQTSDKIKNLIPKGMLSPATRCILTNAIYFKADWSTPFAARDTRAGKFKLGSGEDVEAQMMHKTSTYYYAETDSLQLLEMDYLGNDISMLIILPKENNIDKIEGIFTKEELAGWKKAMQNERVSVTLPKFKFEAKYFMAKALKEMGMPTAFKYPEADFTGMSPAGELYIDDVIHQTFVEVAEYGTEAAAATAVMMKAGIARKIEQPKIFNADHPFNFIIQQKNSGNILFIGRMSGPEQQ